MCYNVPYFKADNGNMMMLLFHLLTPIFNIKNSTSKSLVEDDYMKLMFGKAVISLF